MFRCHDPNGLGMYRRYFFECDPMKTFVVSSNKCDYVHVASSTPNTCQLHDTTASDSSLTVPASASVAENDIITQVSSSLDDAQLEILQHDPMVEPPPHVDLSLTLNMPATVMSPSRCIIMIGECESKTICSSDSQIDGKKVKVCNRAFFRCPEGNTFREYVLCKRKSRYNPNRRYCVNGKNSLT